MMQAQSAVNTGESKDDGKDEIIEIATETTLPKKTKINKKRLIVQGALTFAVAVDGLYSPFLLENAPNGVKAMYQLLLNRGLSPAEAQYILYAFIGAAVCNLGNDWLAMDIPSAAASLAKKLPSHLEIHLSEILSKYKNNKKLLVATLVAFILQVAAVGGNFPVGAAADAIPVVGFISKHLKGKSALATDIIFFAIIVSLEVLYYIAYISPKLNHHAYAFVKTIADLKSFLWQLIFQEPAANMETFYQVCINSIYRGASFFFIMRTVLKQFDLDPDSKLGESLEVTAALISVALTWFSRLEAPRAKFLNPDFKLINPEEYKNASGLNRSSIWDFVLSLNRGVALGFLAKELFWKISPWNYVIGTVAGSWIFSESFYVYWKVQRREAALAKIDLAELDNRREAATPNVVSETTSLLESGINTETQKQGNETNQQIFNKIADTYNSPVLKRSANIIVTGAQILRFLIFALSVYVIYKTFSESNEKEIDEKFPPRAVFWLICLAGVDIGINNGLMYYPDVSGTMRNMAARAGLAKNNNEKLPQTSYGRHFSTAKKVVQEIVINNADDYRPEALQTELRRRQPGLK